jgi:hypothetical protein
MDLLLWTCGGLAVAGAALTLAFLPRRAATVAATGGAAAPAKEEASVVP